MKKKLKVLVIGGSGFLGSHVSDELSKRGYDVIIFDQKKNKMAIQRPKIRFRKNK